jgi:hypothetical protein
LVHHQIRHQGADPGDGDVGQKPQHALQCTENAQFHQQQGDGDVEHQPHHPAGVAVGQAREEVGPGQGTGIGIGDVDLELGNDHQQGRGRQGRADPVEHVAIGHEIHLGRFVGVDGRNAVADGEVGQQRPAQLPRHAHQHPAGAGKDRRGPPAEAAGGGFLRQEAPEIHLLTDLRDHRKTHGRGAAEQQPVEAARLGRMAREAGQGPESFGLVHRHGHVGRGHEGQPQRLGPELHRADGGDLERHQGNHHDGADHVGQCDGQAEIQFQRQGHDGRLQREQREGEGGVDQRGQRGPDVAEARAAGQQVHVDVVPGGVISDGQPGQEHDQPDGKDGPEGIREAVVDGHEAAHRFQHQEGNGAESGVRHPELRPLAEAARREPEGGVLQGLVGDPGVVIAADLGDGLAVDGHSACCSPDIVCIPICAGCVGGVLPGGGATGSGCCPNATRLWAICK